MTKSIVSVNLAVLTIVSFNTNVKYTTLFLNAFSVSIDLGVHVLIEVYNNMTIPQDNKRLDMHNYVAKGRFYKNAEALNLRL